MRFLALLDAAIFVTNFALAVVASFAPFARATSKRMAKKSVAKSVAEI